MHPREMAVVMPKFRMESEFRLDETLKAMGMKDAFALPPADFSGMTGAKDLYVSDVVHKAWVEVNEEGTEAAAATALGEVGGEPDVFRADHPFFFVIRDVRTGGIVFMGRVMDPRA